METMSLKMIINHNNKHIMIPLLAMVFGSLYTISGTIAHQNGIYLPMHDLERNIPMMDWTIWIYIVVYPIFLIWCLLSYKDLEQINKTTYSFLLLTLISCAIFIIFPVNYPREFYPLGLENDITTVLFRSVRIIDKPSNCLPSLHVGLCYCFSYAWLRENKKKFIISMIVSTAIAISTLTTKQHYSYDIFLGYIIAVSIFYFFDKKTKITL